MCSGSLLCIKRVPSYDRLLYCWIRSVPPKKENGAGKDGAEKNGKGEEKDKETPKTPEERLKEAVRDAQVLAHPLLDYMRLLCGRNVSSFQTFLRDLATLDQLS